MTEIVASYAFTSRLIDRGLSVKARMDELTTQVATGRIGDGYGDLKGGARLSVDIRAELARRETFSRQIDLAGARLETMQTTMARIGALAQDVAAKALTMVTTGSNSVDAVAEQARMALREVASLMNTQGGGAYLFAGTDAANAPMPNADTILTSGFFLQIEAEVATLAVGNGATVLANTLTTAASNAAGTTPFSTFLSNPMPAGGLDEPRLSIPADDGTRVTYGLRANANGAAVSPGTPPTTGSFVRDVLRGLAVLASFTNTSTGIKPDFAQVTTEIAVSLQSAGRALEDERASLGVAERRLTAARERHDTLTLTLTRQVSGIEDAPMEETISRLEQVRTQLQANYSLIGSMREFSLINFI
jgi:flagellin-like hook-associated protein FlgL